MGKTYKTNLQHLLREMDAREMEDIFFSTIEHTRTENEPTVKLSLHSERYDLARDTNKTDAEINISSTQTQTIPFDTIARLNALITYELCTIHARIDGKWIIVKSLLPVENYLMVYFDDILGTHKQELYEWEQPFILYLGKQVESSVSSVNILLHYGKVKMYTLMKDYAIRVEKISIVDNVWIRLYEQVDGDWLDLVKKHDEALPFRIIRRQR